MATTVDSHSDTNKITFCTSCMGYTKYLKETYIKNLEVGKDYDCDFVLVNYNSDDDMENWVKENLTSYIESGKLTYYHTTVPKKFIMGEAKNLSQRLADGEYLCNLDADNFLTEGFMDWIHSLIGKNKYLVTEGTSHGGGGRVLVNKEDFYTIGGYDESILSQTGDHQDFVRRMEMLGRTKFIVPQVLLLWLDNPEDERYKNLVVGKDLVTNKPKDLKQLVVNNGIFKKMKIAKNFGKEFIE